MTKLAMLSQLSMTSLLATAGLIIQVALAQSASTPAQYTAMFGAVMVSSAGRIRGCLDGNGKWMNPDYIMDCLSFTLRKGPSL